MVQTINYLLNTLELIQVMCQISIFIVKFNITYNTSNITVTLLTLIAICSERLCLKYFHYTDVNLRNKRYHLSRLTRWQKTLLRFLINHGIRFVLEN